MPTKFLFRASALSSATSSALTMVAVLATVVSFILPGVVNLIVALLVITTDLFVALALIGFFALQVREIGLAGLAGFVLAFVGIPLGVLLPLFGHTLFLIGLFLFVFDSSHVRVLPVGGMWLWFTGALIAILMGFLEIKQLFAVGLLLAACGRAWLGIALWIAAEKYSEPVQSMEVCCGAKSPAKATLE